MGIHDREYYRRESRFLDAFALRGQITRWIILVNVAVFIVQMMTSNDPRDAGSFTNMFDLNTTRVLHGEVWRLLTCAFLHDPFSWSHIVFNMWFLWIFGGEVEAVYGSREFLAFYLIAALASSVAFLLWSFIAGPASMVGASGAITAVLILCACHFPNRSIMLFFVLRVPIWALAVFQVLEDTVGLFGQANGVAVAAHLGGAAFGYVYFKQQWRVLSWFSAFRSIRLPRSRPRLRIYDEEPKREPVSVAAPTPADIDEHFEAKVDAVLEKVARHGQQSLTQAEKDVLLRASEIYKKRRT